MGCKYQLLCCRYAGEIILVTLNHLTSVKNMVHQQDVKDLVDNFISLINRVLQRDTIRFSTVQSVTTTVCVQHYGVLTEGDFVTVKQTMCRFFQDKRVKVSLFMQDGMDRDLTSQFKECVIHSLGFFGHKRNANTAWAVGDASGWCVAITNRSSWHYQVSVLNVCCCVKFVNECVCGVGTMIRLVLKLDHKSSHTMAKCSHHAMSPQHWA